MNFIQPDIDRYLKELNQIADDDLIQSRNYGTADQIPIVNDEVGKFLYLQCLSHKPEKILEIGFGGGYSCLWMAKALGPKGKITSLELNTDRIKEGQKLIDKFGYSSKVDIVYHDALQFLRHSDELYDMVFLDAIKRSYVEYLKVIPRVVKKGGLFIGDNVLFRGNVVKEDVGAKYVAGTKIIDEFNRSLAQSDDFETLFLPIGDGLSFSVRV